MIGPPCIAATIKIKAEQSSSWEETPPMHGGVSVFPPPHWRIRKIREKSNCIFPDIGVQFLQSP
jgi:hypothetical protein